MVAAYINMRPCCTDSLINVSGKDESVHALMTCYSVLFHSNFTAQMEAYTQDVHHVTKHEMTCKIFTLINLFDTSFNR